MGQTGTGRVRVDMAGLDLDFDLTFDLIRWAGIKSLSFNDDGKLKTPWGEGKWGLAIKPKGMSMCQPPNECLFADFSGAVRAYSSSPQQAAYQAAQPAHPARPHRSFPPARRPIYCVHMNSRHSMSRLHVLAHAATAPCTRACHANMHMHTHNTYVHTCWALTGTPRLV